MPDRKPHGQLAFSKRAPDRRSPRRGKSALPLSDPEPTGHKITDMQESTDIELLRRFRESASDEAFAELVRRHVDFVYSTARRQVNDATLAEEITQATFIV